MKATSDIYEPYEITDSLYPNQNFSFETLFKYPGDSEGLKKYDLHEQPQRISIIGGGAAGLAAAYELGKCNHNVTLYEASNRLGGRIYTHRFTPDVYGELGAMRIPEGHKCVLHYLEEFKLEKRPFLSLNMEGYYFFRGKRLCIKDWKEFYKQTSTGNRLFELKETEQFGDIPDSLFDAKIKEAEAFLDRKDEWKRFTHKLSGKTREYANKTLWEYLIDKKLSSDAIELVGNATGMSQFEGSSFLEVFNDFFSILNQEKYRIEGGMDKLTDAFENGIKNMKNCSIHKDTKVVSISLKDKLIVTTLSNGQEKKEEFDYGICAIPAPRVTRIQFDPLLPSNQYHALKGVTYSSSAKTLFYCKERFWEVNDKIYGGASYTDLINQQCWYPSDNSEARDERSHAQSTGNDTNKQSLSHPYRRAIVKDNSKKPSAFTAAYMWGNNAKRFLALSEQERDEEITKAVSAIHGEKVKENIIEIRHHSWDENENPGCGAYAFFAPGEHQRYQKLLCQPYTLENPKLFFAGEHLSIAHAWIQGAIQTGLAAAIKILQSAETGS